jgi:hypothetical protein
MKRWTRPVLILTVVATMTAAGTYVAYANWLVPSRQINIKVTSATMPRGVTPTIAGSGSGAVVSWHAQEIGPGARMQSYLVIAHSVAQPPRPDVQRTVTATGGATESTTFPYSGLVGSQWYWTLIPKFQSWAGQESEKTGIVTFATPTVPPFETRATPSPAPRAGGPPPTGTATPIPVQSPATPVSSPTSSSSTPPVVPTPSGSLPTLTPPSSSSNPGPPPLPR